MTLDKVFAARPVFFIMQSKWSLKFNLLSIVTPSSFSQSLFVISVHLPSPNLIFFTNSKMAFSVLALNSPVIRQKGES